MKIKDEAFEKLKQECALIGLNEMYTDLFLRGKISLDWAKDCQSADDELCCDGLGCPECLPW